VHSRGVRGFFAPDLQWCTLHSTRRPTKYQARQPCGQNLNLLLSLTHTCCSASVFPPSHNHLIADPLHTRTHARTGLPLPRQWFLSAMPSPSIPLDQRPWRLQHQLDEEDFKVRCTAGGLWLCACTHVRTRVMGGWPLSLSQRVIECGCLVSARQGTVGHLPRTQVQQ